MRSNYAFITFESTNTYFERKKTIPMKSFATYSWSRLCLKLSLYLNRKFLRMSIVSFSCRLFDSSAGNRRAISRRKMWKDSYFIMFKVSQTSQTLMCFHFKRKFYLMNKILWIPNIYGCYTIFSFPLFISIYSRFLLNQHHVRLDVRAQKSYSINSLQLKTIDIRFFRTWDLRCHRNAFNIQMTRSFRQLHRENQFLFWFWTTCSKLYNCFCWAPSFRATLLKLLSLKWKTKFKFIENKPSSSKFDIDFHFICQCSNLIVKNFIPKWYSNEMTKLILINFHRFKR